MSIEKIKADLLARASLDKERSTSEIEKLRGRLNDVPIKRIVDQINYLEKQLLPAVKKKSGEQSADYEFFTEVVRSLVWCLIVAERWDLMENRYVRLKVTHQLAKENMVLLEKELSKYTLMEDLWYTDGMSYILEGIKKRAEGLMDRKG
jgi:hypothetical protein